MIPEKIYISKEHLTHLIEAYGIDTPDEDNKLLEYTLAKAAHAKGVQEGLEMANDELSKLGSLHEPSNAFNEGYERAIFDSGEKIQQLIEGVK